MYKVNGSLFAAGRATSDTLKFAPGDFMFEFCDLCVELVELVVDTLKLRGTLVAILILWPTTLRSFALSSCRLRMAREAHACKLGLESLQLRGHGGRER